MSRTIDRSLRANAGSSARTYAAPPNGSIPRRKSDACGGPRVKTALTPLSSCARCAPSRSTGPDAESPYTAHARTQRRFPAHAALTFRLTEPPAKPLAATLNAPSQLIHGRALLRVRPLPKTTRRSRGRRNERNIRPSTEHGLHIRGVGHCH